MKLHYSQTQLQAVICTQLFYYLMKLHYSQTSPLGLRTILPFYYLMKLHYSQTSSRTAEARHCFTTLWNYTTLKQAAVRSYRFCGFTTLWNYTTLKRATAGYRGWCSFTTLWNYTTLKQAACLTYIKVVLLPYEITLLSNNRYFHLPNPLFYYLMKFHYSQTLGTSLRAWFSLTTLWNYTTLKRLYSEFVGRNSFTTLWNYTTLKPQMRISCDTTIHRVTS